MGCFEFLERCKQQWWFPTDDMSENTREDCDIQDPTHQKRSQQQNSKTAQRRLTVNNFFLSCLAPQAAGLRTYYGKVSVIRWLFLCCWLPLQHSQSEETYRPQTNIRHCHRTDFNITIRQLVVWKESGMCYSHQTQDTVWRQSPHSLP